VPLGSWIRASFVGWFDNLAGICSAKEKVNLKRSTQKYIIEYLLDIKRIKLYGSER